VNDEYQMSNLEDGECSGVNQEAILLSCQGVIRAERQAESEYDFEKTKPICPVPK
jgi:hypothetical protein